MKEYVSKTWKIELPSSIWSGSGQKINVFHHGAPTPSFSYFFNVSDVGLVIYSLKIMIIELFGLPPLFLVSRV